MAAEPTMVEAHAALEHRPSSPADDLLQARFAFADPRGLVTRWGMGAEALFGIAADEIVGESLFKVALADEDAGWRQFLGGSERQSPPSLLELSVTRPDGQAFPCEVHIVPVLLADALDFTQFAADLTSGHLASLEAFGQRHAHVLSLVDAAAHEGAHYAEEQRLAGLIATFRSIGDAPVTTVERIDEALDRAERAEREVEDLRDPLGRVAAEFGEVRAEVIALLERVETLEARSAAAPDAETLAADIEGSLVARIERAVTERVDAVLPSRVERAVEDRVGRAVAESVEASVAAAVGRAVAESVEASVAAAVTQRVEAAVAGSVEAAVEERLEHALDARIDGAVADRIPKVVAETVEQAVAGRVEEALAGRIDEALAAARAVGEAALATAREARAEAEQVGRELRTKRAAGGKPPPVGFYATDAEPAAPDRAPLPGFDDVATPLAMLTLEGRFTHLNGGFRELVGYTEEEFASARWPSPADREHMASQRELKYALAAGEVDEAPVETAFMHREGLLIPLVGRMSLVRDAGGAPDHLLFSVERA